VEPTRKPFRIYSITGLVKNQPKVPMNLGYRALLQAVDNTTRRYIRSGTDTNAGDYQRDSFIIDKDGNVDMNAPIIWDFKNISSLTVYPIDEHKLTVKGGTFITIANRGNKDDTYMNRDIYIMRSNTIVDGIRHEVTGEADPVVSYNGFFYVDSCADVTIQNCTPSGRFYSGKGTYDVLVVGAVNISIINCHQIHDINDRTYWGVFASNYSKNIFFDNVEFSRFDAHRGVHNATIVNSKLGYQGLLTLGSGLLWIENTTVRQASFFVQFRSDYGSTWEGEVVLKDCIYEIPTLNTTMVFSTNNGGTWNYGYPCVMPRNIFLDNFRVMNGNNQSNNLDLVQNASLTANSISPTNPNRYTLTENVYIKDYYSENRKPYRKSNDTILNNNLKVVTVTEWGEKGVPYLPSRPQVLQGR
jgi:hypothetical protein